MTSQSTFGRRGRNPVNEHLVVRAEITQPIEVVVKHGGGRWGRWVLGAFGLCFAVGVIGNLTEGKPPLASVSEAAAPAGKVQPVVAKRCGATLKEYMALRTGISPSEAGRIIGCPGEEISRVAYGGQETLMLTWNGEAGFFSNMNATFDNGRLIAKGQLGLE